MCGTGETSFVGALPNTNLFAGTFQKTALHGGALRRCLACQSMQRSPIYAQDFYTNLYGDSPDDIWSDFEARNDNRIIREALSRQLHVRTVLDVGCNTGTLLESLDDGIVKFGIEPSARARFAAENKGIVVHGSTVSDIPSGSAYDCVMAVDVIEHLPDPTALLEDMFKVVNPNGILILSTGNPAAAVWYKVFKGDFWYSSFAEHLSFPSPTFVLEWAAHKKLRVVGLHEFKYSDNSIVKKTAQLALQLSFHFLRPLHGLLHRAIFNIRQRSGKSGAGMDAVVPPLPCSGLFRDHYVVILQRVADGV
jgi:SAM-dependent methyltransferase